MIKTGRGWWALAGCGAPTLFLAIYIGAYFALVKAVPTEACNFRPSTADDARLPRDHSHCWNMVVSPDPPDRPQAPA